MGPTIENVSSHNYERVDLARPSERGGGVCGVQKITNLFVSKLTFPPCLSAQIFFAIMTWEFAVCSSGE